MVDGIDPCRHTCHKVLLAHFKSVHSNGVMCLEEFHDDCSTERPGFEHQSTHIVWVSKKVPHLVAANLNLNLVLKILGAFIWWCAKTAQNSREFAANGSKISCPGVCLAQECRNCSTCASKLMRRACVAALARTSPNASAFMAPSHHSSGLLFGSQD